MADGTRKLAGDHSATVAVRGEAPSITIAPLTRRRLLTGAGQMALLASFPLGCVQVANAPWADGTFWDDGRGWTE